MALCAAVKAKSAGGDAAEGEEWHQKEMVALKREINERATVRANHFDMDGADDDW